MCGIIGLFNIHDHKSKAATALDCLKNRGKDYQKIISQKNYSLAHALHAVVSKVKQPFEGKGLLVANCEIYNWKEIAKTHAIQAKNDAHLIFQLLEKGESPGELVKKLDGVYSFAYVRDNKVLLVRDLIGVKPLWYGKNPGFGFASEKKALLKSGFKDINELNPRKILEYNLKTKKIKVRSQKFFTIGPEHRESKQKIKNKLLDLLTKAVDKRIPKPKFGLLFSGGVDSSTLALLLKKHKKKFTCYTTVLDHPGFKEPEDLVYAKKAAKTMNLNLKIIKVKLKEIKPLLKKIVPLIEDSNVVKVAVALTFYKACEQARKDGHKVLFSGLGAEELFGGYERHKKSLQINKECLSGLLKMYERDLYRDDIVSMENSVELRLPFLDHDLSKYSLNIPGKYKINSKGEKQILREVAEKLGVPKLIARRKKRAAQYGSNIQKALKKLAKPHPTISSYLDTFAPSTNPKLGALISTGKDSIFAMYTMIKQNYPVECMITLKSKNKDSYMFHTPTTDLAKAQADSIGLPLVTAPTDGKKEHELKDLKKALQEAKNKFGIEGVVTGALYSNYQRERIEKICDSLSLKIFAPLWHIDQVKYLEEILKNKFKFIITKIAAEGLDSSWIGRPITTKDIKQLTQLQKKLGLNPAGEGGEYETLMVDGPIFRKPIKIKKKKIIEESPYNAELIINYKNP